jgi:hypothetical protein
MTETIHVLTGALIIRFFSSKPMLLLGLITVGVTIEMAWSVQPVLSKVRKSREGEMTTARVFPWKRAIATVFWVGEPPGPDNNEIPNHESAWDANWQEHFGGVDDPDTRCGYRPCGIEPKENPFYVALPYDDLTTTGKRKRSALLPWTTSHPKWSMLKNRWVAVKANGKICYAQWQDVGPFESDDDAYVFGDAPEPANRDGEKAGIDLSPAIRDCLGIGPVSNVLWRHVERHEVPDGPWTQLVTTRPGP